MKQEHQQEAAGQSSKSGSHDERSSSSSSERKLKRQEQLARRKHEQQHHQQQHHHKQQPQQQQQQLKPVHRRQESDSKLGNASSAFARAFRRENSDFFPSARHSAYLQKSTDSSRSSIFASGNRRGSEISIAGIVGGKKGGGLGSGEPVLTDFSLSRDGPQRPRREKTESEIVFGNRHEARRHDFGRDKDEIARRRSCRPSDATAAAVGNDAGTIKSTVSTTASEYSPIVTQVSPLDARVPRAREAVKRLRGSLPVCLPETPFSLTSHPRVIFLPVISSPCLPSTLHLQSDVSSKCLWGVSLSISFDHSRSRIFVLCCPVLYSLSVISPFSIDTDRFTN